MKKIVLTGGGTAGHVMPNMALIPKLRESGYEIIYIGSRDGIERTLINSSNITYYPISTGKLRRYFDLKNILDPFRVIAGIFQAIYILWKEKPDIVASMGGFVSVPVVIGAYLHRIPVIAHESDFTPGLANRLAAPFCIKICVTFPESVPYIKGNKAVLTGNPIRAELFAGQREKGLEYCGFPPDKPVLLVIGGSLGSQYINELIRKNLDTLLTQYNIIHICGKKNLTPKLSDIKGYRQFEYVGKELPDLMNAADIVISRAGANVIFELLALKKPNILIPLSRKSSRGDQILNAKSFVANGYSLALDEDTLDPQILISKIDELYRDKDTYIKNMAASPLQNSVGSMINLINIYARK